MRSITRSASIAASALGAGVLLALAGPTAAQAHVVVTPDDPAAGSYTVLEFASGHGCDGSPTTSFAVGIPESILSVTPTLKEGWTVEKVMVELDEPAEGAHGTTVTERVGQVVYTPGAPIEDGYRDSFEIQVLLPEDAEGERLEFPVLQTCVEGENDWSESAADGAEPEFPAPAIEVGPAEGDAHGHGADEEQADTAGDGATDATATAASDASVDVLARVVGIAGLAVGVVGVVLAVAARRGTRS
ncbi:MULTISPECIES: YcnI family copper-binding membrane protein [unclassified Agromyces]|uniref:YcnI family copper-binding membrane protein n=1 Tax=unclassified Agromyces TaxID=2639701 RepID=UPI003014F78D